MFPTLPTRLGLRRGTLLLALLCLPRLVPAVRADEVILQYFESTWDEMYQRIPEIAEAGYSAVWSPPVIKSPEAGTITWGNVGYSLLDRFDLGDTPQRGTLGTRYGTHGSLRHMVDNLHDCDVLIYPDTVCNHNGNGPDYRTYPGMVPNDFHIWQDNTQPGGWKRPPRLSAYDDINNGYGQTFQDELVSLMDIVTEGDGRFQGSNSPNYTPDPTPFIRNPGRPDLYPYGPPSTENVRQMLNRWSAWLGNQMDYDGFRMDAAKHMVRDFFGGPGTGFLDSAEYNFHQRRGWTYNTAVPDLNANDIHRHDMLIFSEIFTGDPSELSYWEQGNCRMRYLDFPQKIDLTDNAFNNTNLSVLSTLGTALDPTLGVMFIGSADQPAPTQITLGYAYLLTHVGVPVVYFSGNNISWSDYNVRTWVKPGIGDALGDYDNAITNLVYINTQFARGNEWNRWSDSGYYAFERYTDYAGTGSIAAGESTLLVALNNTGNDVTHTLTTAFPNGTVLHDYTGHNGTDITVANNQVNVTVPAGGGQGYVCYAPYNASANGVPVTFLQNGNQVGTINWVCPGGVYATAQPRTIPYLTGTSVTIETDYFDPPGSYVNNVIMRWGQGLQVNGTANYFAGNDLISSGFQQATYVGPAGKWQMTADLTKVPDGLNIIKVRLFTNRAAGLPPIFQTFNKVVWVDHAGPSLAISLPSTIYGDGVATIANSDKKAGAMQASIDGGPWNTVQEIMLGTWKYTITGLTSGQHTLNIRSQEFDNGSPQTLINSSTTSQAFTVDASGPNIAMSWTEGETWYLPFPTTTITVDPGVSSTNVTMWWDGWQMTNLSGTGTITHVFDGQYVSGGVNERFYGAFINGPHFFEAEVNVNGKVHHISRTVFFNLYGNNMVDSDGDGLPDDIEWPGILAGINPNTTLPGDTNQDDIPNYGEVWTQLNPLNQDTFYSGVWDGDHYGVSLTGTGSTNIQKVREGFLRWGDPYHYNIYSTSSQPEANVSPTFSYSLSTGTNGQTYLTVDYRPMTGTLQGQNAISVAATITGSNGSSTNTYATTMNASGQWELVVPVAAGSTAGTFSFKTPTGSITDSTTYNATLNVTPHAFAMNGQFASPNYLVLNNGMVIYAAVHGTELYVATWSPVGGSNDHIVYVTDHFGNSQPAPWGKAGPVHVDVGTQPYLAATSYVSSGSNYNTFANGGPSGVSTVGPAGGALEGEIDLMETFGYIPQVLYISAVAYGRPGLTGSGINAQCPPSWFGGSTLNTTDLAPVATASITDTNLTGYWDDGNPTMQTVVNGASEDANYGLRRFFINELLKDSGSITVNLQPNINPSETVTAAQVVTNLNRRDFATLDADPTTATTSDNTAYYRAYPMASNGSGGFTLTLPVNKCGAYRITARYSINGGPWIYYTDYAQRRDCCVVVSPTKALTRTLYEVDPLAVEATGTTSTTHGILSDIWMANTNHPDILNLGHFTALGYNELWLQPIHPLGAQASTGSPYIPGSPYEVKDFFAINPLLASDNTSATGLTEFATLVQQLHSIGTGVMMDASFDHSSPDAEIGQGAVNLFPGWASSTSTPISSIRPMWYSLSGTYSLPATSASNIAVAPDRFDFGKWTDVRHFYFGDYDYLVKTGTSPANPGQDADEYDFLSERDQFFGQTQYTREIWEYFAYYPIYWLTQTGCPPGTPPEQVDNVGIDGLRCDFAQGLPSNFWEYCINKTRCVKWDFIFMAESLDGYSDVNGSTRHGIGFRSSRQFDILNENILYYWRDQYFAYPVYGQGSSGAANPTTGPTQQAYSTRANAYEGVVLLGNLSDHDEIYPSDDPYSLMYAYSEVSSLNGAPMVLCGQEAGAQNDYNYYNFTGNITSNAHNWDLYELNFGKDIANFENFNAMTNLWVNRDWNLQTMYGRINHARLGSLALQSANNYFLSGTSGGYDPNIFAVAKYQLAGVSAAWQDVVFAFINNNYKGNGTNVWDTFNLNAVATSGSNMFGIVPTHHYNVQNLLSGGTNYVWTTTQLGSTLISSGLTVGLTGSATALGQAQYLRLVDQDESHVGQPNPYFPNLSTVGDNIPDWWKQQYGLSLTDPNLWHEDPYGTGYTVYQNYLAGTDPTNPAGRFLMKTMVWAGQNLTLSWTSVPGQNYYASWSTDLVNWHPFVDGNNDLLLYTADGTQMTQTFLTAQSAVTMFFRVECKQ